MLASFQHSKVYVNVLISFYVALSTCKKTFYHCFYLSYVSINQVLLKCSRYASCGFYGNAIRVQCSICLLTVKYFIPHMYHKWKFSYMYVKHPRKRPIKNTNTAKVLKHPEHPSFKPSDDPMINCCVCVWDVTHVYCACLAVSAAAHWGPWRAWRHGTGMTAGTQTADGNLTTQCTLPKWTHLMVLF